MSIQDVIDKVKQFADAVKEELEVDMVILQSHYKGEADRPNSIIDVAVVVDLLKGDQDYIEVQDQLEKIAASVDSRIDVDLIESEKEDPTGFFNEIRKTGRVIYENSGLK